MSEILRDVAEVTASPAPEKAQHQHGHPDRNYLSADEEKYVQSGASTVAPSTAPASDIADEKALPVEPAGQQRQITGIRWLMVVLSILSSTFLFALDNTVVADVQADIVRDFGQIEKLSWLSIAFLVSAVSTNSFW